MFDWFASDGFVAVAGQVLAVAIFSALGWFVKDLAKRRKIEVLLKDGIPVAYTVVAEIARKTPNKVDDKLAAALGVLKDYLATHGEELTAEHADRAKLLFQALHAEKRKEG